MVSKRELGNIYGKKRRLSPLSWLVIGLSIMLVLAFILAILRVYFQANRLINHKSSAFPDVAENAMPVHSQVSFSSGNDNLLLEGWLFNNKSASFRGNIIFIHNNSDNRIQFGLDTADLFKTLSELGFNVLAFDLRNSGRSSGEISTYGYAEYQDVLAAIEQMHKLTGEKKTILYGVGSGTAAALLAWQDLVNKTTDPENKDKIDEYNKQIKADDIIGLILDTPAATPDAYIRADLSQTNLFDRLIAAKFIPTAIRATAGFDGNSNLTSIVSRFTNPILITRNIPDNKMDPRSIDSLVDERLRLHPETSTVFETPEEGHINGFNIDQETYLNQLQKFLDIWFDDIQTTSP